MIEVASLGAALSGLKSAYDITADFLRQKLNAEMQGKVIELQRLILSAQQDTLTAQSAQATFAKRIEELENEISSLNNWDLESQRYKLTDFGGNTFAYLLKKETADGEPIHKICPTCYQKKQKSILQTRGTSVSSQEICFCAACSNEFFLGAKTDPNEELEQGQNNWLSDRF